jgi:site-specific DNA-methyltransferase (adenine-specific)/adenine-specific DNA-methyltransferase
VAVRLEWEDKPEHVERVTLPFQTVETVNESRATRERDRGTLQFGGDRPTERNMLVWGDNKLVMSSLLKEYAGSIRLIYIDPPFDTGTDFSYRVKVGDADFTKTPSILEESAYRDTWGRGRSSYLHMLWERLVLIHDLLSDGGYLFLHLGSNVSHYGKVLCDEIFGADAYVNEIIWKRQTAHSDIGQGARHLGRLHDSILLYRKGDEAPWNMSFTPYNESYESSFYRHVEEGTGRRYGLGDITGPGGETKGNPRYEFLGVTRYWRFSQRRMHELYEEGRIVQTSPGAVPRQKRYLDELPGIPLQDIWTDVPPVQAQSRERLGYDTQKPEALLERIISLASDPDDLVADFFVGSGTTAAVAEKLDRRWIAVDLGRFAIHTTRKRLLNIPDCRPFDIKNLGAYERQRWQQASGNGALRAYLDTILAFYRADPVEGFTHLHGRKAGRMVHVGATDAPVTIDETEDVMDEMADNGIESCDLLGWEWEMGLHDTITERARRRGLDLRPRQIPREVMERQVTEADAVRFFELAHVDLDVRRQGNEACVVLKDFAIPSENLIPPKVRERITAWSDLIDYWAVDFDYTDDVFHNQWQAYRTREEPKLATQSDWHEYAEPGQHAIVVKIIDIFGNDTTKLAEVRIR